MTVIPLTFDSHYTSIYLLIPCTDFNRINTYTRNMPDITNIHEYSPTRLDHFKIFSSLPVLYVSCCCVQAIVLRVLRVFLPVIQLILFPRDVTTRFVLKFSKNLRIIGSQSVSLFSTKYYAGRALKLLK